jgi:hypothetical protein
MPLIYRTMQKEGDLPKLGRSATTLGVRIPADIAADESGRVSPSAGGMSVAPAWRFLRAHRIPRRLKHLAPDATGSNNIYCWRMGDGAFVDGRLADGLSFRRDTAAHGLVEPATIMPLPTYEAALEATRDQWVIDET